MSSLIASTMDLERLFKLRVAIARAGEMDLARWWNTKGQLGPLGAKVLRRGLPRTHRFAQARSVFAVAAHRCREVYTPPDAVTLWELPAALEERLDAQLEAWLDKAPDWEPFFLAVEGLRYDHLRDDLESLGLVTSAELEAAARLRRSAQGRAVAIPGTYSGTDHDLALLALGFTLGEVGALAVPFMRLDS